MAEVLKDNKPDIMPDNVKQAFDILKARSELGDKIAQDAVEAEQEISDSLKLGIDLDADQTIELLGRLGRGLLSNPEEQGSG